MNKSFAKITVASALLAIAGSASAAVKQWNAANGTWNTPANWFLAGVPLAGDTAQIGNTIAAQNAWVNMNIPVTIAALQISDGMVLDTTTSKLTVNGSTTITGSNSDGIFLHSSKLNVDQGAAGTDCDLQDLTLSDGGRLEIDNGATVLVRDAFIVEDGSGIYGEGVINFTKVGGSAFTLNGTIQAAVSSIPLTLNQLGTGRFDLDGTVAGDHIINVTGGMNDGSEFADLVINGDQLLDAFDDDMWIGGGNSITMNLSGGWAVGPLAELSLFSAFLGTSPATLSGSQLSFAGSIDMPGTDAWGRINNDLILQPTAAVVLGNSDVLEFRGDNQVLGGTYTLGVDSRLYFGGTVDMSAATFLVTDGGVDSRAIFSGPTNWHGTFNSDVTLQQYADAIVTASTTVNAPTFDLDGDVFHNWTINSGLVLNLDLYDTSVQSYDTAMTISGAIPARLTMNLSNPNHAFHIGFFGGILNLASLGNLTITRYAGSPLTIHGQLNITGSVRVDAPLTIAPNGTLSLPTAADILNVTQLTRIDTDANETGVGSIRNASTGNLILDNGANLGDIGITNDGEFRIDDSAGAATISRFTNSPTGNFIVQIGGHNPGSQHDTLAIGGTTPASLDGTLSVNLIDIGNGPFIPSIGDTFTVLDCRSGIVGTFDNSPISIVSGTLVEWTIIYGPRSVSVRADNVYVRCPADFNQDGIVDFFDYLDFVDAFSANLPAADFNHDSVLDFFDYLDFVDAFSAGC